MGMSDTTKLEIYALVAGVLHLGNLTFEENPEDVRGGCQVSKSSEHSLSITAKLLGVDSFELRQALVSRVMQSKGGGIKGTVIMLVDAVRIYVISQLNQLKCDDIMNCRVPLKIYEANNARDALAKALYSRLFDRIVAVINQSIPFSSSTYYIGVLDIAGFGECCILTREIHLKFRKLISTNNRNFCRIFHREFIRTVLHKLLQ